MKALVLVDVQNDFVSGSLGSDWAKETTIKIGEFLKNHASEYAVVATRDTHFDDTYLETLEGKMLPVKHCIKDTWGWQLCDEVKDYVPESNIVDKNTFMALNSGKENISSKVYLATDKSVDEIIICGFVTSICVVSNALYLRGEYPNTKITVLKALCADISKEAHEAALMVMQNCQINIE